MEDQKNFMINTSMEHLTQILQKDVVILNYQKKNVKSIINNYKNGHFSPYIWNELCIDQHIIQAAIRAHQKQDV